MSITKTLKLMQHIIIIIYTHDFCSSDSIKRNASLFPGKIKVQEHRLLLTHKYLYVINLGLVGPRRGDQGDGQFGSGKLLLPAAVTGNLIDANELGKSGDDNK